MSVTIRLSRTGRKNLPSYRVVVSQTRNKRDGKFIDIIGHFNPSMTPISFDYDKKKYEEWIKKGALVTDAVSKLIEGKYEYKAYKPSKEVASKDSAEEEAKVEKSPQE